MNKKDEKYYSEDFVNDFTSKTNNNLKDRTGIEVNNLKFLKHHQGSNWFVKCHCNKIFSVSCHSVIKGATKSCGCTRQSKITEANISSQETVISKLKDKKPEYIVTNKGNSATDKWDLKCTICDLEFSYSPSQVYGKRGRTPCKCSPSYRRSEDEWDRDIKKACRKKGYTHVDTRFKDYKRELLLYCPLHDHEWWTRAGRLLDGIGCNFCGEDITANKNKTLTTDIVISNFRQSHGDKFDYSQVVYGNWNDKLKIGCKEHGWFYQRYKDHQKSSFGCPSCAKYGFKPNEKASLYLLIEEYKCKIGITNNDVVTRLKQINSSGGKNYKIAREWLFTLGQDAKEIEQKILSSDMCFGDEESYSGSTEVTDIGNMTDIINMIEEYVNDKEKN